MQSPSSVLFVRSLKTSRATFASRDRLSLLSKKPQKLILLDSSKIPTCVLFTRSVWPLCPRTFSLHAVSAVSARKQWPWSVISAGSWLPFNRTGFSKIHPTHKVDITTRRPLLDEPEQLTNHIKANQLDNLISLLLIFSQEIWLKNAFLLHFLPK